jgi:carboxymethylenebutenolidase
MRARHTLLALLVLAPSPASAQGAAPDTAARSGAARDERLPASEETAKAALETSPRHGEFVDVPYAPQAGKATPLRTYVVHPERRDSAGVVIVIHEIFGLSDWIRALADQLAREGFVAVAPDLISGLGPGGGGTDSVESRDDVVKLVRGLSPAETRARLDAVRAHARRLPATNGRIAAIGFCWGGSRSFEYAASAPPPDAVVVFYGASPDSATLLQVRAPVLAHYGGDDARVNATIEPARAALRKSGRTYETHVHEGAGHGFLRAQSGREGANLRATRQAWPRTVAFLRQHLR